MASLRNNPRAAVNVDDYRDMMVVLVIPPPDADTERCCHCHYALGVCECIPGERSILLDDDSYTVVDAEFEVV